MVGSKSASVVYNPASFLSDKNVIANCLIVVLSLYHLLLWRGRILKACSLRFSLCVGSQLLLLLPLSCKWRSVLMDYNLPCKSFGVVVKSLFCWDSFGFDLEGFVTKNSVFFCLFVDEGTKL